MTRADLPTATHRERLSHLIETADASVAVIGLGYVGLPLLRAFFDAGFPVIGYDTDDSKVKRLLAGENYLDHLGEDLARPFAGSVRFTASSEPSALSAADVIIICVPTPLGPHREPDLSYVLASGRTVAAELPPGRLVILSSTTYPGTTSNELLPLLEAKGLTRGEDLFVAYSPEREDPGRTDFTTTSTPRLVGGIDEVSCELATQLFREITSEVHPVQSAEVAESAKLLENIYRAVNIALVNELKVLLTEIDIDIWQVIGAAATKPFGFQPFYPGPGLGGHCIPIDPFYLTWRAKEAGLHTRFIELAGEINTQMPGYVVSRVGEALNDRRKPLHGSRILIVGVAYKPNVSDIRETPAAEIIDRLLAAGADVAYHDPHISHFPNMRNHRIELSSVALDAETLENQDCVVVVTDHRDIDWALIGRHASLVVDTRNAMVKWSGGDLQATVVRA